MAADGVSQSPGRRTGGPGTDGSPPQDQRPVVPDSRPPASGLPSAEPRLSWRRPGWRVALTAVLMCYAWLLASTDPFTLTSLVLVMIPGAIVAGLAIWGPPGRIEAPERLDVTGFSYWLVVVALLFEWEAASFRDGSPSWHPALTQLVNVVISPHPLKTLAVLWWLLTGWALVRR
jgi:hypothetical protein